MLRTTYIIFSVFYVLPCGVINDDDDICTLLSLMHIGSTRCFWHAPEVRVSDTLMSGRSTTYSGRFFTGFQYFMVGLCVFLSLTARYRHYFPSGFDNFKNFKTWP